MPRRKTGIRTATTDLRRGRLRSAEAGPSKGLPSRAYADAPVEQQVTVPAPHKGAAPTGSEPKEKK